jgi:pimeloyl-ACP methyl ester carboxylesterase
MPRYLPKFAKPAPHSEHCHGRFLSAATAVSARYVARTSTWRGETLSTLADFIFSSGNEVHAGIVNESAKKNAWMTRSAMIVAVCCALLLVVEERGSGAARGIGGDGVYPQIRPPSGPASRLAWQPCEESGAEGLQCATISVPLDHQRPKGPKLTLALIKRPAENVGARKGSLIVNPGGPGGSGVWMVKNLAPRAALHFGEMVAENFDIIGFDPRGVARSGALRCVSDEWLDATYFSDATPLNANKELQTACLDKYGPSLANYSTEATARDLDLIRASLGEAQLTFYGASYGTYLGAVYVSLFPSRVRAMVLDSAYMPSEVVYNSRTTEDWVRNDLVPFEEALQRWSDWCRSQSTCRAKVGANPTKAWDLVAATLRTRTIPSGADLPTNLRVLQMATQTSLYRTVDYQSLADALGAAINGDGSQLFTLAAESLGRVDGEWPASSQAPIVISCASGLRVNSEPRDLEAGASRVRAAAPHFSTFASVGDLTAPCDQMTPRASLVRLREARSGSFVVIGGASDPATPIVNAKAMQRALGSRASLVINEAEGHIARRSSACITSVIESVIALTNAPVDGYTCVPDEDRQT